jgi:hypothetical protein
MPLPVLAALIVVLIPISLVYGALHRMRSAGHSGEPREIPRVAASEVSLGEVLRRRQPVILEGLADSLDLDPPFDMSALRARARDLKGTFLVKQFERRSPYFLYTGDYGRRLVSESEMTFDELLRTVFDEGVPEGRCIYHHFQHRSVDGQAASIIDGVAKAISGVVDHEPEKSASGVWIGSEGVTTPLHYDAWPGLLFQMYGSKRVWMFSPGDCANLYLLSPFAVGDRWSALPGRSGDADAAEFPRFARADRYEGELRTGDALFIPPFWPHEVEALESNVSMPFRFKLGWKDYLHPRCLRPMCELFHRRYLARSPAK